MSQDWSRRLDEARLGLMVLTRLPAGRIAEEAPDVAASAWSWPVAGLIVGLPAAVVLGVAHGVGLPGPLAAVLAVAACILMTGALHEDGLADLFDGLGGACDREHALEIMRDSRIGSYGALALGLALLIRVLALGAMGPGDGAWALIGLAAASRAVLPWGLVLMPPARAEGLGRAASGVTQAAALVAAGIGLVALWPFGLWTALVTGAGVAAGAACVGLWAKSRLGGQTGDVLGAMQQAGELAGWLVLAAAL